MKTQPTHTPTPWTKSQVEFDAQTWADLRPENGLFECVGKGQDITAITFDFDGLKDGSNAAFIVRAVNAYEELLRVCKLIYEIENEKDDFCPDWMTDLREAISRAEGRS